MTIIFQFLRDTFPTSDFKAQWALANGSRRDKLATATELARIST